MNKQTSTTAKVITVTLNPYLDRTLTTQFLALGYRNQTAGITRLDPAGRGVSIARAVHSLGIPAHAIVLIGTDATGRAYEALLTEEQFPISVLRREGHTRSTITIRDTGHNHETVIVEESGTVTYDALEQVVALLHDLVQPGDRVVFAGTLPTGLPDDAYVRLIDVVQEAGGWVAVNAGGGEPLRQSLKAHPNLIYLTQNQAEGLFNFPVRAYEDVISCAGQMLGWGASRVLLTMAKEDVALLVTGEGIWMAEIPLLETGTHSGQTEAMIAGYLAGRLKEHPIEEAFELAAAAAAYTGAQVGHEFGTLKDIKSYTDDVNVTPVSDPHQLDEPPDTQE